MKLGTGKNFLRGILFALLYATMNLIIPLIGLNYLTTIKVSGIAISYSREDFFSMVDWIIKLGIIVCAIGFFKKSSPKGSRRMAWLGLFQTITQIAYVYMYKYGGATEILISFDYGWVILGLNVLLFLVMGRLTLNIFFNFYNIIYNSFFYKDKEKKKEEKDEKSDDNPEEIYSSDDIKFKNPNNRSYMWGFNISIGITVFLGIMMQGDIFAQFYEYFSWLVIGLEYIVEFLKIILLPFGNFMAAVISELSVYLDAMDIGYVFYIILVIIIITALIVNIKWPYRTKKSKK
ncbi:MAG: hypothetical protein GF329_07030 [Candidatus Lokiarchaeota archaeon]|nr:hypothetical protein [Candidatus Lokiarchaeota archaeon]